MSKFAELTPELQARLEGLMPIRIVLRVEDGHLQGLVEHSFSMDWMDRYVNIFWSGTANSIIGQTKVDGIKWAKQNYNHYRFNQFMVDPFDPECPIEIDWSTWFAGDDKFSKRNAPYRIRPNGTYVLRALAAERELAFVKAGAKSTAQTIEDLESKLSQIKNIVYPPEDQPDCLGEDQ